MNKREMLVLNYIKRVENAVGIAQVARETSMPYDAAYGALYSLWSTGMVRKMTWGKRRYRWEFASNIQR